MVDWNAYKAYGFNLVSPSWRHDLLSQVKATVAQPGCSRISGQAAATKTRPPRRRLGQGGHRAVSGFYVADEPSVSGCSSAPS